MMAWINAGAVFGGHGVGCVWAGEGVIRIKGHQALIFAFVQYVSLERDVARTSIIMQTCKK